MGLSLFDSDKKRIGLFPSPKVIAEGPGFPDTDGEKSNGGPRLFPFAFGDWKEGSARSEPPFFKMVSKPVNLVLLFFGDEGT